MVLFAVSLVLLILMLALTIDVGFWYHQKAMLQTITDLSVMSGLGTNAINQSVDGQKAQIRAAVDQIAVGNGYQASQFTVSYGVADNTVVTTVTVDACITVATFFWRVMGVQSITVCSQSKAEDIRPSAPKEEICCSAVSATTTEILGQGGETRTDSYSSAAGSYNPTNPCTGTAKLFDRGKAAICTNGTTKLSGNTALFGSIWSIGNVDLDGTRLVVKNNIWTGGTASGAGTEKVYGTTKQNLELEPTELAMPVPPSDIASTGNTNVNITFSQQVNTQGTNLQQGILRASGGGTIYIPAGGRYYFTDIQVSSQTQMLITGTPTPGQPTVFWVNGNISLSGGVSFQSTAAKSTDLRINGYLPGSSFDMTTSGNAYMDVWAPQTELKITSQGVLYGRLVGSALKLAGGGTFIFDEALGCVVMAEVKIDPGTKGYTHLVE